MQKLRCSNRSCVLKRISTQTEMYEENERTWAIKLSAPK